jgi:hypothetical protein
MLDNSVSIYLSHYYHNKPKDCFEFRRSFFDNISVNQLIFALLLSDYEDAENVYLFCRNTAGRNYSARQKRDKFVKTVFSQYEGFTELYNSKN